jgi:hypothetical protein
VWADLPKTSTSSKVRLFAMRLTLRTMLAYLDDILEPADFQDISKKIAESEFATNLVHRTRDVTRRMRLGAPKLSGRGMGLDPNTVAEYLDNTLAAERVPDFEKVCLESDVHLAEITASHQILTLVLGEPAHVDPGLRRRLYHVGSDAPHMVDQAHEAHAGTAHAEHHAAPPPLPFVPIREKPVVPDYLRESSKSRWRTGVLAVLAVALVGGAIVMALGGPKDVLRLVGIGGEKKIEQPNIPPGEIAGARVPPAAEQPSSTPLPENSNPEPALPPATNSAAADTTQPELRQPIANGGLDTPPATVGDSTTPPSGPPEAAPPAGAEVGATLPPTGTVPAGGTGPPMGTGPAVGPTPAFGTIPPGNAMPAVGDKPPVPTPLTAGNADGVGRLVSDEDILLRLDAPTGSWRRLPSRAPLARGDKLLVLPTFRPTIILSSGVTVQLVPETMVELEGADADGVLGLVVPYGRVVLMNSGKPDTQIRLRLGEQQGKLVFGNADATVAAEVRRFRMPGVNPEAQRAPAAVDLYCTNGQVRWSEVSGGEPKTLKSPSRMVVVPHPAETGDISLKELPKWITTNQVTPIDERAARTLYKVLDDQNTLMKLKELAVDRRAENRSLAIRCLAHIGQFDEFVEVLNDPDQYSAWAPYTEAVDAALARSPEMAAKIRAAFEKKAGEKGDELYRMLWGYSTADLESGSGLKLVEYLDHEDLPFRVLAFWNLKNITGSTLNYRPEVPPMIRKQAVQRWRDRLREGQVVPKQPIVPKKPASSATDAPPG